MSWLTHLSAQVVRIMLDYTDHVCFCTKLKETLEEQKQWLEICEIQSKSCFVQSEKLQSSVPVCQIQHLIQPQETHGA